MSHLIHRALKLIFWQRVRHSMHSYLGGRVQGHASPKFGKHVEAKTLIPLFSEKISTVGKSSKQLQREQRVNYI